MRRKLFLFLLGFVLTLSTVLGGVYIYGVAFTESRTALASAPATTQFVEVGGDTIAYREIDNGASTTVLFVGGLSAWSGTWERVMLVQNAKRHDWNYIAMDLPPFGYSTPSPTKNYFRDTQAARIAAFLDAKHVTSVILVGHSYGAGPVVEYALGHRELVAKLIIIDGVLGIDAPKVVPTYSIVQWDALRTLAIGIVIHHRPFATAQLKKFVAVTANINAALLDTYTRYFDTVGVTGRLSAWFGDYVEDPLGYQSNKGVSYKTVRFPVRVIWGDKDTITPLSEADPLRANMRDVRVTVLRGLGHIPMIEGYALFDTALSASLAE